MFTATPTDFQMHGEFAGFIRTREGKKRMILRVSGEEILLKVERELRRELSGHLAIGAAVAVAGVMRTELFTGESKRVVTHVKPLGQAAQPCTFKVCAKKNCWKQGGRELWQALETAVAEQDLGDAVRLKAVGCLDECKHAPNVECQGHVHRHCTPAGVRRLLAEVTARTEEPDRPFPCSHP